MRTLALLGALSLGCSWDARQQDDILLGLPCDMSADHVQAWQDAAWQWRQAFPYHVEVVACEPSLRDQIKVQSDTLDDDLMCDGKSCEWMATQQLGQNRAHGCAIDIQVKVESRGWLQAYRNVAAHEMGHCLGLLEHDLDEHAVMYYAPLVAKPKTVELTALRKVYEVL